LLRPVYKPHSVGEIPWRSSLWAGCLHPALAAYPKLERDEQPLASAWPCSWWGLPGHLHCCRCR